MKKLLMLLLLSCSLGQAQIIQHNISDDGYARVPLQFGFPYYGSVFTESYMFSNGVVGFLNPTNSWCCTGFDLRVNNGTPFNFAIMPLQTDLINYGQGRFLSEGTTQYQRYKWENISEYGRPQNLNTFGLEIRPTGYIGMHYEQVNISAGRPVTIGMTGNTSLGEYTQTYHGPGFVSNQVTSYITQGTVDLCVNNPLYSPSCAGYEQAYLLQQCNLNTLYNQQCPGYAEAYLTQQCGLNALYDTRCSGYTQAYFNQQCSLNPLYDRGCSGYAEAYALNNIVSTPTASVSAPVLQVSSTGTVSVTTPVVSDPVVNEVITRPTVSVASPTQTSNNNNSQTQSVAQAETKQEKKTETKPTTTSTRKAEVKNEIVGTAPQITQPVHEYKAPIILDLAYQKMVKKPITDNNRAMYNLIMNSQIKHEEMVDEQYRKRN
jgi:hypothetical protein